MDLSDGLADGIRQIAAASGVGITIDASAIPLSEGLTEWRDLEGGDPVEVALSGGDDYELLFTVRQAHRGRLRAARSDFSDLPITKIGVVTKEHGVQLRDGDRLRPLPEGFDHFGQSRQDRPTANVEGSFTK
jgi:thiamine-monophosphate kinase